MVGEERAYLGGAVTCDFQTRYGFYFFQLHSRYEKAEPVPGSFHASIFPHVGSLRSPTWGFQKYNSYRVANMENDNTYYKYKTFKSTIHTELLSHLSPVILPHGHYDETIGWRSPRYLRQMAWQDEANDEVI